MVIDPMDEREEELVQLRSELTASQAAVRSIARAAHVAMGGKVTAQVTQEIATKLAAADALAELAETAINNLMVEFCSLCASYQVVPKSPASVEEFREALRQYREAGKERTRRCSWCGEIYPEHSPHCSRRSALRQWEAGK